MALPKAYIHVLAPCTGAISRFLDDAERSFLELGIAPTIDRPRTVSVGAADEWAQTSPAAVSEGGWLPYLAADTLDELDADGSATITYAGIAGMRVVGRVLRETTGSHPSVVLQEHTYTVTPDTYTVYRYDELSETFQAVAHGRNSSER